MLPLPDLFARLLQQMAEFEAQAEIARQMLAEDPDFAVFQFFKALNHKKDGVITAEQLLSFAELHGVMMSPVEAAALLRELDRNQDGLVGLGDFGQAVLPYSSARLREIAAAREQSAATASLEVTRLFLRWLNYELAYVRGTAALKTQLYAQCKGSLASLFRLICPSRSDTFNIKDLKVYFNRVQFSDNVLETAFHRLCKSPTGRVSYPEFARSVHPSGLPSACLDPQPAKSSPASSSLSTEQKFTHFCLAIVRLEQRLEAIRRDLACRADFTIEDTFRLFSDKDTRLTSADLKAGLHALGLFAVNTDIHHLGRRISEAEISLRDWEEFLLPVSKGFAESVRSRVAMRAKGEERKHVFTAKTMALLRLFFGTALTNEQDIASLKAELGSTDTHNSLFGQMDCDGDGEMSETDLGLGLERLGERVEREALKLLFGRFSRGKRVRFADFAGQLSASEPQW